MQGKRAFPLQLQPFSPRELGRHWHQEHVTCDICNMWLYDQQAYYAHADECHPVCPLCDEGKLYSDWNEEYRTHLRSALFLRRTFQFAYDVLSQNCTTQADVLSPV